MKFLLLAALLGQGFHDVEEPAIVGGSSQITMNDGIKICFGTDCDYWHLYDQTDGRFELWSSNCDGAGTDCMISWTNDAKRGIAIPSSGALSAQFGLADAVYATGVGIFGGTMATDTAIPDFVISGKSANPVAATNNNGGNLVLHGGWGRARVAVTATVANCSGNYVRSAIAGVNCTCTENGSTAAGVSWDCTGETQAVCVANLATCLSGCSGLEACGGAACTGLSSPDSATVYIYQDPADSVAVVGLPTFSTDDATCAGITASTTQGKVVVQSYGSGYPEVYFSNNRDPASDTSVGRIRYSSGSFDFATATGSAFVDAGFNDIVANETAAKIRWASSSILTAPADGHFRVTNAAASTGLTIDADTSGATVFTSGSGGTGHELWTATWGWTNTSSPLNRPKAANTGTASTTGIFHNPTNVMCWSASANEGLATNANCITTTATAGQINFNAGSDSTLGKGQATGIVVNTKSVTFAANPGDASKTTSGTLIPAGAFVIGITSRVTTTATNCSSVDIGTSGDTDAFANDTAITSGTTTTMADGTAQLGAANVSLTPALVNTEVVVTANTANCFDGVWAITAHYFLPIAQTSN